MEDEFPFRVCFDDEQAVDNGGVSRDLFSGYWEEVYKLLFDSGSTVIPSVHPHVEISKFKILGTILLHGYLACGYLPVRIVFPVLAATLLGPSVRVDDTIHLKSFCEYLSLYDQSVLKKAIQSPTFIPDVQASVINLLSKFGCRETPTLKNVKNLVVQLAVHEFTIQPLGAVYSMNSGIPQAHKTFWEKITVGDLYEIYQTLGATAESVLQTLKEPFFHNKAQQRVFCYLQQMIGNMKPSEVSKFLRFVTGSSVLVSECIEVKFNSLSGIARLIAHICSYTFELPTSYTTYQEFEEEINDVISNDLLVYGCNLTKC